ncbi:MAG: hypothetical protein GON13_04080 [Nanoarchaeota archaeon]|nr:hypothetical protein [Nanoarchaeota archaeon]
MRWIVFLLFFLFSGAFAFESCEIDDVELLVENLKAELLNWNESFVFHNFFNVSNLHCWFDENEEFVNGSFLTKLNESYPVGISFFFKANSSSTTFFEGYDYYDFNNYFVSNESSVLSDFLLAKIIDFELNNSNDVLLWIFVEYSGVNCFSSFLLLDSFTGEKLFWNDSSTCKVYLKPKISVLRNVSKNFLGKAEYFGEELFVNYEGSASIGLNVNEIFRLITCSENNCSFLGENVIFANFSKEMIDYNFSMLVIGSQNVLLVNSSISCVNKSPASHIVDAQIFANSFFKNFFDAKVSLDFNINQAFSNTINSSTQVIGLKLNNSKLFLMESNVSEKYVLYYDNDSQILVGKPYLFILNNNSSIKIFDDGVIVNITLNSFNDSFVRSELSKLVHSLVEVPEHLWFVRNVFVSGDVVYNNFFETIFFEIPFLIEKREVVYSSTMVLVGLILTLFLLIYFKKF